MKGCLLQCWQTLQTETVNKTFFCIERKLYLQWKQLMPTHEIFLKELILKFNVARVTPFLACIKMLNIITFLFFPHLSFDQTLLSDKMKSHLLSTVKTFLTGA